MASDGLQTRAVAARQAILSRLGRDWPESVDLEARHFAPKLTEAEFLDACVALQDEGLIMYEALLVGAGPSPMLIAALLTHKGQAASASEP
jgi:hypothetical protein